MKKPNTMTIGCDLGDKFSQVCVLNELGEVVEKTRVRTTRAGFEKYFGKHEGARVVLEVGTHSRWTSELLNKLGLDVIVANARQVKLIFGGKSKSDVADAEVLARLGRVDPKLLAPIQHRGNKAQIDLVAVRARDVLVQARTKLINSVRGFVKSFGYRLKSCTADSFHHRVQEDVPNELMGNLTPMMDIIRELTGRIRQYDKAVEQIAKTSYPKTAALQQISGVGPITAMAFILTLEDPIRFEKSRNVPAFLGLCPKKDQTGENDKQLGITKAGDPYLRRLLVNGAHYILGPFGPETDLRTWGLKLAERGGKNAKKRAVVATARKLAVLLHRLWLTGEVYEPIGYGKKKGDRPPAGDEHRRTSERSKASGTLLGRPLCPPSMEAPAST